MITGFQLRGAKLALRLTAKEIADPIGIHPATILRLCNTENLDYLPCSAKNLVLMKKFFESKNIIFPREHSIALISRNGTTPCTTRITSFQFKIARAATCLTQEELSFHIKISSSSLSLLENLANEEYIEALKIHIPTLKAFFERLGITFPDDLSVTLVKNPKVLAKKN